MEKKGFSLFQWIMNSFSYPTDSDADKIKKAILVYIAIAMSFGGLGWGIMCLFYDAYQTSIVPFSYTALTIVNFILYKFIQSYSTFRFIQFTLSLLLPFFMQWGLGGFGASGGTMLWAILSPLGGLMFYNSGRSFWFISFLVLTLISTIFDSYFAEHFFVDKISLILYPMNFFVVNIILFFIFRYFVVNNESIFGDLDKKINQLSEITDQVKTVSSQSQENSIQLSNRMTKTSDYLKYIDQRMNQIEDQFRQLTIKIEEVNRDIGQFIDGVSKLRVQIERQNDTVDKVEHFIIELNSSISEVKLTTLNKVKDAKQLVNITQEGFKKVNDTNSLIESIVKQTDSMKDMLEIINGISTKTHLLAMNASIEAAHASTEGKGFAVVAGEIRKLANSTANNSKNIALSLNEIIDIIHLALEQSTESGESFNHIREEVLSVLKGLQEIESEATQLTESGLAVLPDIQSLSNVSKDIITMSNSMVKESEQSQQILKEVSNAFIHVLNDIKNISNETKQVTLSMNEVMQLNKENNEHIEKLNVLIAE